MAHVLLASVNEVALLVARSDDKEAATRAGADTIDELLQRLFDLPVRGWNEVNVGFHYALAQ